MGGIFQVGNFWEEGEFSGGEFDGWEVAAWKKRKFSFLSQQTSNRV